MGAGEQQQVTVTLDWTGAGEPPIMASNVFLVQNTPHEFILTFGVATPPVFAAPPTPEQLRTVRSIPARAIVRLAMAPGRVVELLQILQQQLALYQQSQRH